MSFKLPTTKLPSFNKVGQRFNFGNFTLVIARMDDLIIPEWQRKWVYTDAGVRSLKHGYNPQTARFFTVAAVGSGKYEIVDGGRRLTALKHLYNSGKDEQGKDILCPCNVIPAITVAQKAQAMLDYAEGVLQFGANAKFNGRLWAKDPIATRIASLLAYKGITIVYHSGFMGQNETCACAALLKAYTMLQDERFQILVRALATYRRPDFTKTIEADALRSDFILGMALMLSETDASEESVLTGLARGNSASEIKTRALDKSGHGSGARVKAYAHEILVSLTMGAGSRKARLNIAA